MSLLGNPLVSSSFPVDNFVGDGTTVSFELSQSVGSPNAVEIFFNGVHQNPTGYSIAGKALTFTVAPPNSVEIVCRALGVAGTVGVVAAGSVIPSMLSAGHPIWDTSGNLVVTGQITGNLTGAVTGNSSTATSLQTSRTINGVVFDGTSNISVNVTEAQVTDGTLLARLAANETVSGSWQFSNPLVTAAPVSGSHATTKDYVDQAIAGLSWKTSVLVATTENITLAGLQVIDGVAVVDGNRILVKNQTTQSQNGVYTPTSALWIRATDFDQVSPIDEINGAAVFVQQGLTQADTSWTQANAIATVGTDPLVFVQFAGANTFLAGNGMSLSGNTFNVGTASANRLVINTDNIDLALVADSGTGTFKKITTDGYGRVSGTTPVVAADITGLVDSAYVNVTGDTMTGDLSFSATTNTIFTNNIGSVSGSAPTTFLNNAAWIWKQTVAGGNAEWMRLLANGNLGIGSNNPSQKLHIYSTSAPTVLIETSQTSGSQVRFKNISADFSIGNTGAAANAFLIFDNNLSQIGYSYTGGAGSTSHRFNTEGVERMRISGTGNVGVGTTNPIIKLHINTDTATETVISRFQTTNGADTHFLDISIDNANNLVALDSTGFNSGAFAFRTGSVERMRLAIDGKLSIGTTGGAGKINVRSTEAKTSASTLMIFDTTTGGSNDFQLIFGRTAAGANAAYTIDSIEQGLGYRNLALQPNGGKIGIGTNAPSRALHIKSNDLSYGMLRLESVGANSECSINFRDDGDVDTGSWVIGKNLGNGTFGGGVDGFGLYYNGLNRLAISATGIIVDGGNEELGFKNIKPVTAWIRGQCNVITANISIGVAAAGDVYSVYNDTSSNLTITPSGVTMRLGGTTVTGARTLLPRGFATIWYRSATESVINGNVT